MPSGKRYKSILIKVFIAISAALILSLLGQIGGIGYHIRSIRETSFIPHIDLGYADARFHFEAIYNPILYPFYWVAGSGEVDGNFSMMYLPQSWTPGDFGVPFFGSSPESRYENYISYMLTWGTLANFLTLLGLALVIEAVNFRKIYLALFLGIIGFSITGAVGIIGGLASSVVAFTVLRRKRFTFKFTGLQSHILKRISYSFVVLILVITVDFMIFMLMPGNPLDFLAKGVGVEDTSRRDEIQQLWGINQPLIPHYFTYLRNLLTFNFGKTGVSFVQIGLPTGYASISSILAGRLPFTIFLLGISTLISAFVGVTLGILTVQKRNRISESLVTAFSSMTLSLPAQWIGLILLLVFGYTLRWFPLGGGLPKTQDFGGTMPIPYIFETYASSSGLQFAITINMSESLTLMAAFMSYAILPICTQILFTFGTWVLLTRGSMMDTLEEDYLVTAKAKGLSEFKILSKHALRNACLPIITSVALAFGFMFTGSMIVESLFHYPGMGDLLFQSAIYGDNPVLMVIFYVISIGVILANMIADMLYGILDPRIRYG